MNDSQMYLAIGLPTIAVLTGIIVNGMQFHNVAAALNARMSSVETRLDMLISKVMDFDGRLTRFEERMQRRG
jgi:hypothetical protein